MSSAVRQGRRLIAVTMNAPDDWQDHKALLEQGFSQFTQEVLVRKGDVLGSVPIAGGTKAYVQLLAGEEFICSVAQQETADIILPPRDFVYAPVAMGQEAGFAHVTLNGVPVGKVCLEYGETIEIEQLPQKGFWVRLLIGE